MKTYANSCNITRTILSTDISQRILGKFQSCKVDVKIYNFLQTVKVKIVDILLKSIIKH